MIPTRFTETNVGDMFVGTTIYYGIIIIVGLLYYYYFIIILSCKTILN